MPSARYDMLQQLQNDILPLQGFKAGTGKWPVKVDLGPINDAFPHARFPTGAVHEFVSATRPHLVAATGFVSVILSSLMQQSGVVIWASASRTIFAPALKSFGIDPHRIIFLDLKNEKQVAWAIDESLKVNGLAAVVGEMQEVSFTASRRFQLAVENSQVTGFLFNKKNGTGVNACLTRWKISSLPSLLTDPLPGLGFPAWKVELLKVRNGKPGAWDIACVNGRLTTLHKRMAVVNHLKKTA